ncbi:MAG TPA: UDP-N-acetylmuramoyl-tripeptide--D-alanyl-D-alanine ligase, partial [Chitinophagaceae bacterium]|nr:UDP-N-acetylmuramoyl-tripeptide--D-alanyl-D-alanine ligase [Chitinophagaceae bacterium]
LSAAFKTYTTQGNLNNHIGVPLTILQVRDDAEMAVIEMGANHQKEIASYCQYTLPTHGIITNVGKAHLEGFGGEEGVRKGKGELYDFLRDNGGTVFAMWDYDYLREMSRGIEEVITYGTHDADIVGKISKSEPFLEVDLNNGMHISTKLVGGYNLPNVLVAVTAGKHFGVSDEKIKSSIEAYTPSNSRSQLIEKGSNKIILDAYNANPSSMRLAIENLAKLPGNNKVLMLGGMAELGEGSVQEHQNIVDLIKQYEWKDVVLVGGDFLKIDHPFHSFKDSSQAAEWYKQVKDSYVLIKGSRSMQMEKVLN